MLSHNALAFSPQSIFLVNDPIIWVPVLVLWLKQSTVVFLYPQGRKDQLQSQLSPKVLVPAHNEESVIVMILGILLSEITTARLFDYCC